MSEKSEELRELSAMIVAAYVAHNNVTRTELVTLIESTYAALAGVGMEAAVAPAEPQAPAVSIKKSITPEAIICLEDGKSFKSLKRHLRTSYDMSPDDYRAKWKLPPDYPMVAPAYAERRSQLAKSIGLGRKAAVSDAPAAPVKTKRVARAKA